MADTYPITHAGHEPAAPTRPDRVNGKLLPCPFCSGAAVRKDDPGVVNVPFGLVVDHAPSCFLAMPFCTDDGVIDRAWNTRPVREEVSGEEVERVARAMCAEDPDIRMGDAEGVVQQRVEKRWPVYIGHARAAIAAMNPKPAEAAKEWEGPLTASEQAMIDGAWDKHKAAEPGEHLKAAIAKTQQRIADAFEGAEPIKAKLRATPATEKAVDRDAISDIISDVAELPDRDSPEDWPDAMIVTGEELRIILERYTTPPAADVVGNVPQQVADLLDYFALKDQVAAMRKALEGMVETYTSLINSGDAGHWDPEKDEPVIAVRSALAALPEDPSA